MNEERMKSYVPEESKELWFGDLAWYFHTQTNHGLMK